MGNRSAANWLTAGLGLALLAVMPAGSAWAGCQADVVELRTAGGEVVPFMVEVADDESERARGLMFRESMPARSGMLFVYEEPGPVAFWMKNTLIPLDMVFADATGTVVKVHENAIPKDEMPIPGGSAVQFVLEINGGFASRLGITEGSVLRHPAVPQDGAAWACN